MRVCLAIPGPLDRRTGGYSYDVDLVEFLQDRGHEVRVLDLPPQLDALDDPADVVIFDGLVHHAVLEDLERRAPRRRALWVALIHVLGWLLDPAPTPQTPRKQERERRFLRCMDATIANSDDTRRTITQLLGEHPGPPPCVVCRPLARAAAPSLPSVGGNRLLFLANPSPAKNLMGLLRALAQIATEQPLLEWDLRVVGSAHLDAEYTSQCRALTEDLGLADRVRWLGRKEGAELENQWAHTDLLVVPSFREGWGMVYAEALVRGVVPLAADRGGGAEAVGDAGLLVDPFSQASLAGALTRWLTDAPWRREMAQRALARGRWLIEHGTGFAALEVFLTQASRKNTLVP